MSESSESCRSIISPWRSQTCGYNRPREHPTWSSSVLTLLETMKAMAVVRRKETLESAGLVKGYVFAVLRNFWK